jgi:hypothetical protein
LSLSFWQTSKIKRMLIIIIFFFLSIIATLAGSLTPLRGEEISTKNNELEQLQANIKDMDVLHRAASIFQNNIVICLISFIPVAGPIFGYYTLYNTGVYIAAESLAHNLPPIMVLLFLFVFPFTWLEFLAYSTALCESFLLIWRIRKGKGKRELVNLGILISICAALLALAAVIEAIMV